MSFELKNVDDEDRSTSDPTKAKCEKPTLTRRQSRTSFVYSTSKNWKKDPSLYEADVNMTPTAL
jgi:BRCT domain type II-containing protein